MGNYNKMKVMEMLVIFVLVSNLKESFKWSTIRENVALQIVFKHCKEKILNIVLLGIYDEFYEICFSIYLKCYPLFVYPSAAGASPRERLDQRASV